MHRIMIFIAAALALPVVARAQSDYISISVWNLPADPALIVQNPDVAATLGRVVDLGADRVHAARISETSAINITFYPASDDLETVLANVGQLRDATGGNPGFELLQVLQGPALPQVDATPITSGLSYVLSSNGNAVSSANGGCLQLNNSSGLACAGGEEHLSLSVWNVPADPAVLAQDPNLAAQLQAFVDLGADRLYPIRVSDSSVAFATFYPVTDALEDVLAAASQARQATAGAPGFDLVEVIEARVIFTAD